MASGMKTIVGVALAVAIAAILLGPVVTTVNGQTGTQEVTNETVTAETGEWVNLDGYNVVESSVTVYGYNDSDDSYEEAIEGTDYELDADAGEIKALNSSSLIEDGEDIKVTYDYEATDAMTETIIGYGPTFLGLLLLTTVGMKVQKEL
jgi:hypothetical protein